MEGRASWTVPPSAPIPIFLSGQCCGAGAASQAGGAAEPAGPPLPRSAVAGLRSAEPAGGRGDGSARDAGRGAGPEGRGGALGAGP